MVDRGHRRGIWVAATAIALVLLGGEIGARIVEPRLPPRLEWPTLDTQTKVDALHALSTDGGVDTIVLGSSIAETALNPAVIAASTPAAGRVYNAALSGARPTTIDRWLQEVVLPAVTPAVAIVEVSPRTLIVPAGEGGIDEKYRRSSGRRRLRGDLSALERVEAGVGRFSALARNRSRLRDVPRLVETLRGDPPRTWRVEVDASGWRSSFADSDFRGGADYWRGAGEVDRAELAALRRIVRRLERVGTDVVLVDMPMVETEVAKVVDGGAERLRSYQHATRRLAADEGVSLVELQVSARWGRATFADAVHPNRAGTELITRLVSRAIEGLQPVGPAARPVPRTCEQQTSTGCVPGLVVAHGTPARPVAPPGPTSLPEADTAVPPSPAPATTIVGVPDADAPLRPDEVAPPETPTTIDRP